MCGRYGLFHDPMPLLRALGGRVADSYRFVPHYNVAPQQRVLGVANVPSRELSEFRWGLVTSAAGDPRGRISTINARIETVATSRLYGPLLPTRRCVVFADGYYEWHIRSDGSKQPTWITRRDGEVFAFAGLWDDSHEKGEPVLGCTIVTQPANLELSVLHERMPVVLGVSAARAWLAAERLEPPDALALLAPADGREWTHYPVSNAVGNVKNDSADLLRRAEAAPVAPSLFDALG